MATLLLVLIAGLVVGVVIGMKMRGQPPAAAPQAPQKPAAPIAAPKASPAASLLKESWIAALGGANNIRAAQAVAATRVRVELQDGAKLNEPALKQAGVQAVAAIDQQVFHLIVGAQAA